MNDEKSKLVKIMRNLFNSREHHLDSLGYYISQGRYFFPSSLRRLKERVSTYRFE